MATEPSVSFGVFCASVSLPVRMCGVEDDCGGNPCLFEDPTEEAADYSP